MSTTNDSAPIKHLVLNRQTVKNLTLRTGVRTGAYGVLISNDCRTPGPNSGASNVVSLSARPPALE